MKEEQLLQVLRDWLGDLVDDVADGSPTLFARKTKIKQADISNTLTGKKGRKVTWRMIALISEGEDMPKAHELLASIAKRLATASVDNITGAPQLQRQKLRARLASGEIYARAASGTPTPRRGERPSRRQSPPPASSSKTDPKG